MKNSIPLSLAIGLLLVLFGSACSSTKSAYPNASRPMSAASSPIDVYLIPMDDFNFDEAWRLAQSLGTELGIKVKATVNMGSAELRTIPGSVQYAAEDIIEMAHRIAGNLRETHPTTAYVVLTRRDINSKDRALRYTFAMNSRSLRTAVVSTARMDMGENGGKANPATLRMRLTKMVKRNIGEVYYGYTRSADIQDIMYSPIMSLDDVDKMGSSFLHKPIR